MLGKNLTCIYSCSLLKEHGHSCADDSVEHGIGPEKRTYGNPLEFESIPRTQLCQVGPFPRSIALLKYGLCLDL